MKNSDRQSHSRPCISQIQVRQALNLLRYSSGGYTGSLTQLTLVDEYLAQPNLPDSPHLRLIALQDILIGFITAQLTQHRNVFDLAISEGGETQATAIDHIRKDATTESAELIGWSWLYYSFVRCELTIRPATFCAAAGIEERTLRRYQHHTIWRLTVLLIASERRARAEQYQ